jgi:hypothetical protein
MGGLKVQCGCTDGTACISHWAGECSPIGFDQNCKIKEGGWR